MTEPAERDVARANAYRLLADCYQLPERVEADTVAALATNLEIFLPDGAEAVAALPQAWPQGEKPLQDLRVAHAKLFVGPYDLVAPPYGSVYLDGERRVMGESTMGALSHYKQAGLDPSGELHEPPDHITAELEFMYFLAHRHLTLHEGRYLDLQRDFLQKHLSRWIPPFSARVVTGNLHPFYNQLARLTSLTVQTDAAYLGVISDVEMASVC